jgi:membrane-associated protease RseP (regulator of RpoE activity)
MISPLRRILALVVTITIASCTHVSQKPNGVSPAKPAPISVPLGRYEIQPGRGADTVVELRAAAAPAQPELTEGQSPAGDEHVLATKGFVHIGDAYYAGVDSTARAWLLQQAREVGADKVFVYELAADASNPAPSLHAVYYVRFRLPFGANFRDLNATEKETLGTTGVSIGAVIGGSPAAEANLRDGDYVLKFNGNPIRDRADFQQLLRAHMGKRVTLTISRNGTMMARLVRLGVLTTESGSKK